MIQSTCLSACLPLALLFLDPPYLTDKSVQLQPNSKKGGLANAEYACGPNWGIEKHQQLAKLLTTRQRWILCHAQRKALVPPFLYLHKNVVSEQKLRTLRELGPCALLTHENADVTRRSVELGRC